MAKIEKKIINGEWQWAPQFLSKMHRFLIIGQLWSIRGIHEDNFCKILKCVYRHARPISEYTVQSSNHLHPVPHAQSKFKIKCLIGFVLSWRHRDGVGGSWWNHIQLSIMVLFSILRGHLTNLPLQVSILQFWVFLATFEGSPVFVTTQDTILQGNGVAVGQS